MSNIQKPKTIGELLRQEFAVHHRYLRQQLIASCRSRQMQIYGHRIARNMFARKQNKKQKGN